MSLILNNPLLKSASGMLGQTLVFRQVRGKLVLANRPTRRMSDSPKQKVQVDRFREASQYARKQMENPASKVEYLTAIDDRRHNAYTVALADFLNAPTVHFVKASEYTGAIGDTITIKATDDFKVVGVKVTIIDSDGVILEKGDAVPSFRKPFIWKYQASVVNPNIKGTTIRVTAFDKPGNGTLAEIKI